MLKNKKDIRAVVFMIITTSIFILLWKFGFELPLWAHSLLYLSFILMSLTTVVITHNHNHVAMWKNRYMNIFQENWLTVFYGFPIFSWIPTHNTNHHTHINKEEDLSRTYRTSSKNNLFTLLTYPSQAGAHQFILVKKYFKDLYTKKNRKFYLASLQIFTFFAWLIVFLVLDFKKGFLYVVIPQQFAVYSIWILNYIQHVDTDENHKYNNSRNFVGAFSNFFLLNNGFHLVHHLYPSQHWSELKESHAGLEDKIDPRLNQNSYLFFLFKTYIASLFIPRKKKKHLRAS